MICKILKFRLVSGLFLLSLISVAGSYLWAYLALQSVGGPLIIHFNSESGINQTGTLVDLLWFVVTAILVVIINFFIALELEARDWFWGKLLASATLFFALLILVGFASIISVN